MYLAFYLILFSIQTKNIWMFHNNYRVIINSRGSIPIQVAIAAASPIRFYFDSEWHGIYFDTELPTLLDARVGLHANYDEPNSP